MDPAPIWLVKQHRQLLAPLIALPINTSLSTGSVPAQFKHAVVTLLLQNRQLRQQATGKFSAGVKPTVSFSLGVMTCQAVSLHECHGTEMALIKVMNDILMASDQGQVSALCLLDSTAAFDTVDHGLLLTRVQQCFGIKSSCVA